MYTRIIQDTKRKFWTSQSWTPKEEQTMTITITIRSLIFACLFAPAVMFGQNGNACTGLPNHAALRSALQTVVVQPGQPNGGLDNNMWATVVNRDGQVCAVVFSGSDRGD